MTDIRDVYTIIDRGDDKDDIWVKVGVAFPCKNSEAINIRLNALPVNGVLHVKAPKNGNGEEPSEAPF